MWIHTKLSFLSASNVRAMLMIPVYEQPIDTTENIFHYDKVPQHLLTLDTNSAHTQVPLVNLEGSFWKDFLLASPNSWERRAGEEGVTFSTEVRGCGMRGTE